MLRHRVIPVLLMRDGGLVKTEKFKNPKYVGDPINAIRIFNDKEVDELVLLDITRGGQGRGPDFDTVRDVAGECFIPLAYGGGVSTVDHAARLFGLGIEKVVVRHAAAVDLRLIEKLAAFGGSQSVTVCIDVAQSRLGRRRLHAPGSDRDRDPDWLGFAARAAEAGAGEIVLQSVARDGTGTGLDLEMVTQASARLSVPVVAVGGVGRLDDIRAGVDSGASAVGAGSFFVFHGPRRAVLITYPDYGQLESMLGSVKRL